MKTVPRNVRVVTQEQVARQADLPEEVSALIDPALLVEIEADAYVA